MARHVFSIAADQKKKKSFKMQLRALHRGICKSKNVYKVQYFQNKKTEDMKATLKG